MKKLFDYLVIILELLLVVSLVRGLIKTIDSRRRVDELLATKEELVLRQEELRSELEEVDEEFYLEKVARDELNLTREGEAFVIVHEGFYQEEGEEVEEVGSQENWERWLEIVFGSE